MQLPHEILSRGLDSSQQSFQVATSTSVFGYWSSYSVSAVDPVATTYGRCSAPYCKAVGSHVPFDVES